MAQTAVPIGTAAVMKAVNRVMAASAAVLDGVLFPAHSRGRIDVSSRESRRRGEA